MPTPSGHLLANDPAEHIREAAAALGVSGWVRNRLDGTVEALVHGPAAAVEELLRACRRGPRFARVDEIEETLAEPEDEPGFRRLPTG